MVHAVAVAHVENAGGIQLQHADFPVEVAACLLKSLAFDNKIALWFRSRDQKKTNRKRHRVVPVKSYAGDISFLG